MGSFDLMMALRASLLAAVCLLAVFAQPATGGGRVPRADVRADAGSQDSTLQSVSCASAGNCDAVGGYTDSNGPEGLLLSEREGVWRASVEARLPANAAGRKLREVVLWSISCPSPGDCVAVGKYMTLAGFEQGLILTETEGVWQTGVAAPLPGNPRRDASLRAVSCASAGNCAAVGTYRLTSNHHSSLEGLLVTERGGTWKGSRASLPADAHRSSNPGKPYSWTPQRATLESVSCASADSCSAVGEYKDANSRRGESHSQGLLLSESGGVWEHGVEARLPANAWTNPVVALHSISCPSAGNCAAVGGYLTYDSQGGIATWPGLLVTESGGTWQPGVEQAGVGPPSSAPFSENLFSVSCPPTGDCVATGGIEPGNGVIIRPLLVVGSGTQWQAGFQGPVPADASDFAGLSSVSCAAAGNCAAVGGYHRNGSQWAHGLLLSESGGTWDATAASLPADATADAASYLTWVSCPSAGNCTAIGEYVVDLLHPQGLLLSETGGTWGTGVAVQLPP